MFAHLLQKDLVLGNSLERLDEVGVEEEPIIDIVRHHLNGEGEGGGARREEERWREASGEGDN